METAECHGRTSHRSALVILACSPSLAASHSATSLPTIRATTFRTMPPISKQIMALFEGYRPSPACPSDMSSSKQR
jgi:hypothetical protein